MFNGIPIQPAPAMPQAGVNLTPATQITQALATLPIMMQALFGGQNKQNQNQQQNPQGALGMLASGTVPTQTVSPTQPAAAPVTGGQMTLGPQPAPFAPNTGYMANRAAALPPQLPITGLGQAGLGASGLDPTGVLGQLLRGRMNQNPFMQPPGSGFASGIPSQLPGQTG